MKKVVVASVLTSFILSTGCASIVSESSYPVAISSSPSNAQFVIEDLNGNEIHAGHTPATVTLSAGGSYFQKAKYRVTFHKDGYVDKTVMLESTLDGWYFGNILLGGLIGMLIVDPITGAMWKLPDGKATVLEDRYASTQNNGDLTIVSIDQLSDAERNSLVRIN
ncbi:conserved hypothetical protein [Hahella chejuensis KCTC 2396]|uniref:PEGA domain-containing protein n=1 Tax=Hahella chejuensis (strain KCTC 2396) TaxID=349521 RepID=Q2SQ33_HAHCH|nr:hypothetical protein [Hahella chejuensis]ABC27241.1 conserved hypothetical protein [Hahella chejuensis KCTC 2396]